MDESALLRRLRANNPDALWDSVVSVAPRNPAQAEPAPTEPSAPPDSPKDEPAGDR